MTELRNLASTCEFGNLHENLLLYKVVDEMRSDKIRDVLLRKGVEMTLEKAINICRTEEITKMQIKVIPWMARDVNFMEKFTNQESVLDMGRNATSAKRRVTGQAVV